MMPLNIYLIPLVLLALVVPFFLYRTIKGPSVFDRLIGLSGISTKAVLLLVLIGVFRQNLSMYIDIAIGYGLLNLVGTLAIGKYLEKTGGQS